VILVRRHGVVPPIDAETTAENAAIAEDPGDGEASS
jgi:hypothetical protein